MNQTAAEVRIRPLDELDIGAIVRLAERVDGDYRPDLWERRIGYYLRRDPEGSFVAEAGGEVVGFMLGEVRSGEFGLEEPTGWIEVLGVDPDFRGQAVGRALAETMLARFRTRGATKARTLVDESMPEILRYFSALGFEAAPIRSLVKNL